MYLIFPLVMHYILTLTAQLRIATLAAYLMLLVDTRAVPEIASNQAPGCSMLRAHNCFLVHLYVGATCQL